MPKPPPRLSERTGEGAASASLTASSKAFVCASQIAAARRFCEPLKMWKPSNASPRLAYLRERLRHLLGVDAELLRPAAHLHSGGLELEVGVDADRDTRGAALALRKEPQAAGSRETIRR